MISTNRSKAITQNVVNGWEFTKPTLKNIACISKQHDVKVAIIIIPTRYQVHQDIWKEFLDVYEIDPETVDLTKPQRILREFGEKNDIEVIDLLPKFKEIGEEKRLYFKIDGHWNKEGNQLAAEEIDKFLISQKLVPIDNTELF